MLSSDSDPAKHATTGYQVLARKWRPQTFADLVGQEHVVQALTNALDRGQLHHAYLFTGTRGVGKTTLARILAKSLNCDQGVSASPCGTCSSCREIHEGRFIDLQEIDAASRTKVEQTRELLENVPFAPVRGRYKVYLIDEVHMFSGHSFNALLKTLEEPPPHVKFVLATTDPQKLPATVLSRCLQFNLKHLLPEQIGARFLQVLETEGIEFEQPALALLARAAEGSMRDGLSLLDQGIAFGGGQLRLADVRSMLGALDQDLTLALLEALCDCDAPRLLAEIGRVSELTPDFAGVLKAVIGLLHRLALAQQVPATLDSADPDYERLHALAERVAPEDLQLYYQVAVMGQQDLPLAPDARTGLEMVFLRALAFRPDSTSAPRAGTRGGGAGPAPGPSGAQSGTQTGIQSGNHASQGSKAAEALPRASKVAEPSYPESATTQPTAPAQPTESRRPVARASAREPEVVQPAITPGVVPPLNGDRDWHALVEHLPVNGLGRQLASHCAFNSWAGGELHLHLEPDCEHLIKADAAEQRLAQTLQEVLGQPVRLRIEARRSANDTPARARAREEQRLQREAEVLVREDPIALGLVSRLNAEWVPGSFRATGA
ncbi:DNA polymerase III subunit gamma/tau [Thiorhodovibrio frisius]|uniref:DNA polymerase III subunit gamma/tau n=1 Tax=Thiorhodovibrio frisius TaxID=631362 RepID=H8Z4E4_9GAMM|nr:DNA polymerase III subunit gamma/tau [Thiorhodovibrio frisius]EIC20201.1 DNA polymerase III, subunit gamma/tau [Thiorhodovibrio frisius]WPL20939.1 DNA polymerase III subunit tau [Thiorhodovibrio frisius]